MIRATSVFYHTAHLHSSIILMSAFIIEGDKWRKFKQRCTITESVPYSITII